MNRGRSRTQSTDFLNDEFGFLAPKISKSPIGRAKYDKAGYPIIGQREFKFPEYKPKQYNGIRTDPNRKVREKYKSRRIKKRRTQSMGNRAFATSLSIKNTKSRDEKVLKPTSRYQTSRTVSGPKRKRHSLPTKPPTDKPPPRPRPMPMDISSLPESTTYVIKKPQPIPQVMPVPQPPPVPKQKPKASKPIPIKYKTIISPPVDPVKPITHAPVIPIMPQDYSPSAFTGVYGGYPTKAYVTVQPVHDDKDVVPVVSKKKTKSKKKKKKKKKKKAALIEDGKKGKGKKKKAKYQGSIVGNRIKLFESDTVSTDDEPVTDHKSIVIKPIQHGLDDDVLSLQKQMVLKPIEDVDDNANKCITATTDNDEKDTKPHTEDEDKQIQTIFTDDKSKTEEPIRSAPAKAVDDLSDSRLVITNNDDEKQSENDNALLLEDDTTKTEQNIAAVPPKDSDDLSGCNVIIHKPNDNEKKRDDLSDSNVIIHKPNTNAEDDKDGDPFASNHVAIVAPNDKDKEDKDGFADSKLIIHKKEDEKEKDPNEFGASGLRITQRPENDDDGTRDPFGAEQTAMERKRDVEDDEDALWGAERLRLEQEMEKQLQAEEDRYKMRMLAIRQMRDRLRKKGPNGFEEQRMWLSEGGKGGDGWQLKWPFDFSSLGFNLNWITVQYDDVEYNEEGNVVLTVHGQKVELPSSKVLKNTDKE